MKLIFGLLAPLVSMVILVSGPVSAEDVTNSAERSSAERSAAVPSQPDVAAQPKQDVAPKQRHFLYLLRVAADHRDAKSWTEADNDAVSRHFERLKASAASGEVIIAGRTSEPLDQTFGIVIFQAADEAAARRYMEADPAVVAGVMTATLHPYAIAVQHDK